MIKPNIKCEVCGKEFYKKPFRIAKEKNHCCSFECQGILRHSLKVKEIENKFNKPIKEILYELYVIKKYPTRKVGKIIGLSYQKVGEWLKKYDIPIRYGSEAIKTQWIDNEQRREKHSELMKKVSPNFDRSFMYTDEYRKKQSESKKGSKNGMYGVIGEKHHNWRFDKTKNQRIIERKSYKYSNWRNSVFKRDNYECKHCGYEKGGKLIAHHINSYDIHELQRYDIDNGVTLCKNCHKDFHSKYGYGKNTREQFEEWIKAD